MCWTLPPLPAGRGAIRNTCKESGSNSVGNEEEPMGVRAYVEQAHKGNIRSTLRVLLPESTKQVSWCEITQKIHNQHTAIIKRVAEKVNDGSLTSQAAAVRLKEKLCKDIK